MGKPAIKGEFYSDDYYCHYQCFVLFRFIVGVAASGAEPTTRPGLHIHSKAAGGAGAEGGLGTIDR